MFSAGFGVGARGGVGSGDAAVVWRYGGAVAAVLNVRTLRCVCCEWRGGMTKRPSCTRVLAVNSHRSCFLRPPDGRTQPHCVASEPRFRAAGRTVRPGSGTVQALAPQPAGWLRQLGGLRDIWAGGTPGGGQKCCILGGFRGGRPGGWGRGGCCLTSVAWWVQCGDFEPPYVYSRCHSGAGDTIEWYWWCLCDISFENPRKGGDPESESSDFMSTELCSFFGLT